MKKISLFVLMFCTLSAAAQDLISSRQSSYYTYVYKLSDNEAREIYRRKNIRLNERNKYFHSLVDSFPTYTIYRKNPGPGHYLKVYVHRNRLIAGITSIVDINAQIVSNNTDLCIQLYEQNGNILDNADVRIGGRILRYDQAIKSYVLRKSNKKGILEVNFLGNVYYYDLSRQINNPLIKRAGTKVLYKTPLVYVWQPVKFIVSLPVDGVKAVAGIYPHKTVSWIGYKFRSLGEKVGLPFNEYNWHFYDGVNKHKNYFVFNKPKYLPSDTVKFKAFIVSLRGKPERHGLSVVLENQTSKRINFGKILPVREGSYSFQFVLDDSLNLDLDRNYRVLLKDRPRRVICFGSFGYEDYELKSSSLSLRTDEKTQVKGKEFKIYIRGTDENDLNILDGRLEITAKSKDVRNYLNDQLFIPDTLFFIEKALEPEGETAVIIPDSLFPPANLGYAIEVNLYRTDNEKITKSVEVDYYNELNEISYELKNDSIRFFCKPESKTITLNAEISGYDNFGNIMGKKKVTLPYSDKINPYYRYYFAESETVKKKIEMSGENSLVDCLSGISEDSVTIKVYNPRKLPFTYFIYKANQLLEKGFGSELNYKTKADRKKKYYLSLNFLWAGDIVKDTYQVSDNENKLNIAVKQPSLIYPGQKANIEINVTDNSGKPAGGVDLTAFSVTKKFGYDPPVLPVFPDGKKGKDLINTFNIGKAADLTNISGALDYAKWERLASLDTIEYFNFIYPDDEIYYHYYTPSDGFTQFSPFVVKNGALQKILTISVDSKPVYFSWTGNDQPYSFMINVGYHYFRIRTRDKEYYVDSVYLQQGKKLVLSINDLEKPSQYSYSDEKPSLTKKEKANLENYIFPFRNNFGDQMAYLTQNDRILLVNSPETTGGTYSRSRYRADYRIYNKDLAGPVYPGNIKLKTTGGPEYSFLNEKGFEYEFLPGIIKMRTFDKGKSFPAYLTGSPVERLSDNPLTEKRLTDEYNSYLFQKKYLSAKFNIRSQTERGRGKLVAEYDSLFGKSGLKPLFLVMMKDRNKLRSFVYPGNIPLINNLEAGTYSVFLVFRDEKYTEYDSVEIKPDGRNYIWLSKPEKLKQDSIGHLVSEVIENQAYGGTLEPDQKYLENMGRVLNMYSQYKYYGEGKIIQGVVKDSDGEPLPGVTVMVKGTSYGTMTDLNGHYSINVPFENDALLFSFIGYESEERPVSSDVIDISLNASLMALDEVVVVGYGTSVRKLSTVSAQSVTSALSGRIAGVQITEDPSAVFMMIRGVSSVDNLNQPLFVIDGVPYLGDMKDIDPNLIRNIKILKDENLIGLYGARAANGVVLISTKGMMLTGTKMGSAMKGADFDQAFLQEASKQNSIRTDFHDYGFWKPDLVTDNNGTASFNVKFPDDVTSWSTMVLAMNSKKQTGQSSGSIKSFKPLTAQLFTPRFLVEGDSSSLIGKVLNYTTDTVTISTSVEVNGILTGKKERTCINSVIDTIPVKALSPDTISATYSFHKPDGYLDGEKRKIPVFKKGLEIATGNFFVLNNDTSVLITPDKSPGESVLYAQADRLDIIRDEINRLYAYYYDCNEQVASKLKALIAEEASARFQKKPFLRKIQVARLIRALEKNQNNEGFWGWWDKSETNLWITIHVLESLQQALQMGYKVDLDKQSISRNAQWQLESERDNSRKLQLAFVLSLTDPKINLKEYLASVNENSFKSLADKFRFIELKQLYGLGFSADSVLKYERKTLLGNTYFGELKTEPSMLDNETQVTLNAYRILSRDSLLAKKYLSGIRNFFFESRRLGRWQNTFETARIIETILPDLLKESSGRIEKPSLTLSGTLNKKINEFPFSEKITQSDSIKVTKTGTYPVYMTVFSRRWESDPSADSTYFTINSSFEDNDLIMNGGKAEKLLINLKVKKDAQYVLVEIPVPGGCSYESKENIYSGASHTEFFRNHVSIFYDHLLPGKYKLEVRLLPRYTGKYTVNPAKAELMYFPTFSSNNELKQVKIR